jgi:hypothetical protein
MRETSITPCFSFVRERFPHTRIRGRINRTASLELSHQLQENGVSKQTDPSEARDQEGTCTAAEKAMG